jgi:hypothetical protein
MNVYNTLFLSRHPLLQPIAKGFKYGRTKYRIWTDASGKGYGAHPSHAGHPIALYQQKRMPFIEIQTLDAAKSIKLDDQITTHETAALYLSLKQWKPFLHGSFVEAPRQRTCPCSVYTGEQTSRIGGDCGDGGRDQRYN